MTVSPNNLFLRSFSKETLETLSHTMQFAEMPGAYTVVAQGSPFQYVYFPDSGVLSRVVSSADGDMEISPLGREGFLGVPLSLGVENSNFKIVSQHAGSGWRIPASQFRKHLDSNPEIRDACNRYSMFLLNSVSQVAACARLHSADRRCAKWLLMTQDRLNQPVISTTQNLISGMLGVVRPSVNMALNALQKDGLIKIARHAIEIIDRSGLEARSCECYKRTDDLFNETKGFAQRNN